MKQRFVSRVIVVALVALVGVIIIVRGRSADSHPSPVLAGTSLGSAAAPGFSLPDQSGTQIALAQLRGHLVVLTFMDTRCAGTCATLLPKLRQTAQALGTQAENIEWLAVNVNPATGSPAAASALVARSHLGAPLHLLLGSAAQLRAVWQAYHIAVAPPRASGAVTYTSAVYVIDAQGHERVYFDATLDPRVVSQDLRILLASG